MFGILVCVFLACLSECEQCDAPAAAEAGEGI